MKLKEGTKFDKMESCFFWSSKFVNQDKNQILFIMKKAIELNYYLPEETIILPRICELAIEMFTKHFKDIHNFNGELTDLIMIKFNHFYSVLEFQENSIKPCNINEYHEHVIFTLIQKFRYVEVNERKNGKWVSMIDFEINQKEFEKLSKIWLEEMKNEQENT